MMTVNHGTTQEKKHKKRDYIVYFIIAFVLIFLTSSFVIENVYDSADLLGVTPKGVKAVYLSAIGDSTLVDQMAKIGPETSENENAVEETEKTN